MSVHSKLMDVRTKLNSMSLTKSGENKFAGYKYFELGDFLPHAIKLMADRKMGSYVTFGATQAELHIIDLEDNSEVVINSPMADANLKGAHPIQNLGAVQTYQRRYLWMAALELVESDAVDASQPRVETKTETKPEVKTETKTETKLSVPRKVVGTEGKWQVVVTAEPDADQEHWLAVVKEASELCLGMAATEDDVMQIFKKNKQLFDSVKARDAVFFKTLMDTFGQRRKELKGTI